MIHMYWAPNQHRTRALIKPFYYWPCIHEYIECYVQTYLVQQQDKVEQQQPRGLLEPLPIMERPWESMTMHLINCLPKFNRYRTIMVMVDKFLNYDSFMPIKIACTTKNTIKLFFKNVVNYWGLPRNITSNRDSYFIRNFLREFFDMLGISCISPIVFTHKQMDKQNGSTPYQNATEGTL